MIGWVWDLLFHRHKWEQVDSFNSIGISGRQTGVIYVLKCCKCGNLKSKLVNA